MVQIITEVPVRDHTPLQEGLRLRFSTIWVSIDTVRDHTPLEEGLRQRIRSLSF